MSQKSYANIKVTELPKRSVEIEGEITTEQMMVMRDKALAKFRQEATLDGFRKGQAPEHLVASKVGELKLLEEAAEMALNNAYPEILKEHKVDAIGHPNITITKLAPGNPLGFKITTAITPEIKLVDYKKAAKSVPRVTTEEVTESEIDDVILNIRKEIAHAEFHRKNPEAGHDHGEMKDEDLPPVDDMFLKSLGGFASVEELRTKIKESIAKEKEIKSRDKRRTEILEKIITESTIEIPDIIVEGELIKMMGQFKDDVEKSGISFEDYLKHVKKTEDDIKKEWWDTATKRARSQVAVTHIAREEGIVPTEEAIKAEVDAVIGQDKGLDRFRVRMYVENFLTNDLVLKFLESQE